VKTIIATVANTLLSAGTAARAALAAGLETTKRRTARGAARVDAFCARLNDGLTAVALALALMTAALFVVQHADMFAPVFDPETGFTVFDANF
jgi:hypothetical protein